MGLHNRMRQGRVGQTYKAQSPDIKWASLIPGRKPEFKVHKTRGQAFNAVSQKMPRQSVAVLEFNGADWQFYFDYSPPINCERCGGPFHPDRWNRKHLNMAKQEGDPNYLSDIVCDLCIVKNEIDEWLASPLDLYLPTWYRTQQSFKDIVASDPEYRDKWNECVNRHHEAKKQRDMIKSSPF